MNLYHALKLKRNPLYLKLIPRKQVNQVLDVTPRRFFTPLTLSSLPFVSLPTKTFNRHFGHIPIYYIQDLDVITWSPLQIIDHLNYYTINRIYLINDNHVFILPNFTLKIL